MLKIPIYEVERAAGLEEKILASASVAYCSPIQVDSKFNSNDLLKLKKLEFVKASENDTFDLFPLSSILVTTCWNINDDVFDVPDTYAARHTPVDKQVNYMHDCADIIGHITGSYVIDDAGEIVPEDTTIDNLPEKYHIVAKSVLYKCWSKEDLQERMDTLIEEIGEGKWFVSMECLFADYDYAIKDDDGKCQIVSRNKSTAFLSKHLRAYGGTGKYENYRVGRVMRQFVFSGKGIVKKPANPESIIFSDAESFSSTATILEFPNKLGYGNASENSKINSEERIQKMADEQTTELLKAQQEIASLKSALNETGVKQIKTELETTQASLKTKEDEVKTLTEAKAAVEKELVAVKAETSDLKAKLETSEKTNVELNKSLAQIAEEQKTQKRVQTVSSKLNKTQEEAVAFVSNLAALNDEQFDKQVELIVAYTTNNPQSGNTSVGGSKPLAPPKNTPAQSPPKNTPGASASTVEYDPAENQNLDELDNVVQEKAVAGIVTSKNVNDVRLSVASYFGVSEAV